ncbi:phosphoglycolate phosphatase-like HAD superfamily hydrolase [Nocardiopsis arvandica]|uniref:Phosphoglycolate phosphatase-like HAD superfamily hydrolase n=1 Tax=Nocardiopsis sinuspersici TaxID=501010 RepID=A0A7Y9XAT1_9ACTN|nr:hypothetical protein [Nocardiopsis sinuspersici]NYH51385.1 phosphoglycolate phosphatase-like HAD superfamily hydrolase [Nocardiopsis sinuspersici]
MQGVHGRDPDDHALMKPQPHLREADLRQLGGESGESLLVGDSVTDIHPGKAERFRPLGCDLIIHSMDELATALKA